LAPTIAAVLALIAHNFLPNQQSPLPTHLYGVVLEVILGMSLILAAVHWGLPRLRPWACHYAPLLAGGVVILAIWDLITLKANWLPLPYFPGPDMVLQSMVDDRWTLFESTWHSLALLFSGYALGTAAGLASGLLIGWSRRFRYWGMPLLKIIGPIPATAFVPLVMAMFPSAFLSGTALIALAVWFPVTMLTISGIANVPLSYLDVARTFGAGRFYLIFRVAVPAALPSIFIGLFMGLGASFLTLIVAETLGVKAGLGWYVKWAQGYVEYAKVYAALVIMAVFFSGVMTAMFRLRDRLLGWQKGVIRW
jgi:NitT/TauT family transport system permease protein